VNTSVALPDSVRLFGNEATPVRENTNILFKITMQVNRGFQAAKASVAQ
jgi:hypothetical protein